MCALEIRFCDSINYPKIFVGRLSQALVLVERALDRVGESVGVLWIRKGVWSAAFESSSVVSHDLVLHVVGVPLLVFLGANLLLVKRGCHWE